MNLVETIVATALNFFSNISILDVAVVLDLSTHLQSLRKEFFELMESNFSTFFVVISHVLRDFSMNLGDCFINLYTFYLFHKQLFENFLKKIRSKNIRKKSKNELSLKQCDVN